MAGEQMRAASFALSTAGSGSQTFQLGGGETRTPKAAYFRLCNATIEATFTADHSQSWGATDGVNEWYGCIFSEDGQPGSNAHERHDTTGVCGLLNSAGTVIVLLSFSAWASGGVTLTEVTAPSSAYILEILFFFAGTYAVGTHTSSGSIDTTTTESGLGFDPTFLILGEFTDTAFASSTNTNAHACTGFVSNNPSSGTIQASIAWGEPSGLATTSIAAYCSSDRGSCFQDNPGLTYLLEYAFVSGGFSATTRTNATTHHVGFLAGHIPEVATWAGILTVPTVTGSHDHTEPNIPGYNGLVGLSGTRTTQLDTIVNGGAANPLGTSIFTEAGDELAMHGLSEHGQTTTNTSSYEDASSFGKYAFLVGTITHDGSFTSGLSLGFRINVTTANSLPRVWPCLVWQQSTLFHAVDEIESLVEEVPAHGLVGLDETLSLVEEVQPHGLAVVGETLSLVEEVGTYQLLTPPTAGFVGEAGFARCVEGEGGSPGAVAGQP